VGLIAPNEFTGVTIIGDSLNGKPGKHASKISESSGTARILKIASTWPKLDFVRLQNISVSPEVLAQLNQCLKLRRFEMRGDMVDTPALVKQEFLQRLDSLVLDNTGNNDEICAALAQSKDLQSIQFCASNLSANGLLKLRQCTQLRRLELRNMTVDALLPVIGKLQQIEEIQFDSVPLSTQELRAIILIPNIRHIYLSRGDFRPDSLRQVEFKHSKVVMGD
jgi:hypothetical protein